MGVTSIFSFIPIPIFMLTHTHPHGHPISTTPIHKARQRAEEAKQAKEAAAIEEQAAYEAKIAERRRSLKPFQH